MSTLKSSRNIRNFYLAILWRFIFFSLLAIATASLHKQALYVGGDTFLLVLGFCLAVFAVYNVVQYIFNAPSIEVNEYSVTIRGKKSHNWNEVEQVSFTGKRKFKFFLFNEHKESLSIKFKSGDEYIFFDSMYENLAQIKFFIKSVIIDKKVIYAITRPSLDEAAAESFVTYKRLQFFNYRSIILWLIIGLLSWGSFMHLNQPRLLVFFAVLGILALFLFSSFLYYFKLSDRFLLIANHNLIWRKRLFRLTDIKEIVFEEQVKMPVSLRIISKDFESRNYYGATLWGEDWRNLKRSLLEKNITIRDESYNGMSS